MEIVWHRDGVVVPSNGMWAPGPPPWFAKFVEVVKGWVK